MSVCVVLHSMKLISVCCRWQSARKVRVKASGRKVKSKEIVDDGASEESNKEKDDGVVSGGGTEKRKRQNVKGKVDKDSKVQRKRATKNKVWRSHDCEHAALIIAGLCDCVFELYKDK